MASCGWLPLGTRSPLLATHLGILVAVEALLDLFLVHVTERDHLGRTWRSASEVSLGDSAVGAGGGMRPGGRGTGRGMGAEPHLGPSPRRQAAVEAAALSAGVPDGEGGPVWQGPFFQEADSVAPDGGPAGRA